MSLAFSVVFTLLWQVQMKHTDKRVSSPALHITAKKNARNNAVWAHDILSEACPFRNARGTLLA